MKLHTKNGAREEMECIIDVQKYKMQHSRNAALHAIFTAFANVGQSFAKMKYELGGAMVFLQV